MQDPFNNALDEPNPFAVGAERTDYPRFTMLTCLCVFHACRSQDPTVRQAAAAPPESYNRR